jgi:hypothetical protein
MTEADFPVDLVILWVDGSDLSFRETKNRYLAEHRKQNGASAFSNFSSSSGDARYNDLNTLRYLLRSIEHCIPWCRRIFLVTNGQVPSWLKQPHQKLVVIRHSDFFPDPSHLPTFNSNAIQLNLHHIADLSEHFVIMDDDVILMHPLRKEDFFRKGLPCKSLRVCVLDERADAWSEASVAGMQFLKQRYGVRVPSLKNLLRLMCHPLLFLQSLFAARRLLIVPHAQTCYVGSNHQPMPFLKSMNKALIEELAERTLLSSRSRFRVKEGFSVLLLDQVYIFKGKFSPKANRNKVVGINEENIAKECAVIRSDFKRCNYSSLCIQDNTLDGTSSESLASMSENLTKVLNDCYPEKSSFEI